MAARLAVAKAIDLGYKHINFEGDALREIKHIHYKKTLSILTHNIVNETKLILNSFTNLFVKYTFREENFVAHNVTKWTLLYNKEEEEKS